MEISDIKSNNIFYKLKINGKPNSSISSLTWSINTECTPELDDEGNTIGYTRGKSVVVGSMMLECYNEHPLLQMMDDQGVDSATKLAPIDITIEATQNGELSSMSLLGVQFTQESDGVCDQDLGRSIGLSFVCLKVTPWRKV